MSSTIPLSPKHQPESKSGSSKCDKGPKAKWPTNKEEKPMFPFIDCEDDYVPNFRDVPLPEKEGYPYRKDYKNNKDEEKANKFRFTKPYPDSGKLRCAISECVPKTKQVTKKYEDVADVENAEGLKGKQFTLVGTKLYNKIFNKINKNMKRLNLLQETDYLKSTDSDDTVINVLQQTMAKTHQQLDEKTKELDAFYKQVMTNLTDDQKEAIQAMVEAYTKLGETLAENLDNDSLKEFLKKSNEKFNKNNLSIQSATTQGSKQLPGYSLETKEGKFSKDFEKHLRKEFSDKLDKANALSIYGVNLLIQYAGILTFLIKNRGNKNKPKQQQLPTDHYKDLIKIAALVYYLIEKIEVHF